MYAGPGTAYIYICYGLHQMLNVVTNKKDIPDAVLIRAVDPITGIDVMLSRTGKKVFDHTLTRGPGNVGKALGVFKTMSGTPLTGHKIFIYEDGFKISEELLGVSTRIGVEGAGESASLPYRYYLKNNPFVSHHKRS